MIAIIQQEYTLAACLLLFNRIFDGLDGAVARAAQASDFGGFLDITSDFLIYAGVVIAFGISNPDNLVYALFLVFSFVGPITTFLAYATIAAKRSLTTEDRGKKSFYHMGGICEGTETTFVLLLVCLVPEFFPMTCLIYGVLCWITTIERAYRAWADFT
jgi:phosphatidylglycerophosphate synthase